MAPKKITHNEALGNLITAFDAQGWREDGETARAVVRAAAENSEADPKSLALAVGQAFLVSNGVDRATVAQVLAAVFGNVSVLPAEATSPPTTVATTNVTITNTGTLIGPVGTGGSVSGVHVQQQNIIGDEAIRDLVTRYADHPQVREVIQSDLPSPQKQQRLTTVVKALGDFTSDTVAKIVIGLLRGG